MNKTSTAEKILVKTDISEDQRLREMFELYKDDIRAHNVMLYYALLSWNDANKKSSSNDYFLEKTGKWIYWDGWCGNHDKRIEDATCSECGYKHPTVRGQGANKKLAKECPRCGTKMSIVDEEVN